MTEKVARLLYRSTRPGRSRHRSGRIHALPLLHAYQRRLAAANWAVEQAGTTIRRQLGLPPPSFN